MGFIRCHVYSNFRFMGLLGRLAGAPATVSLEEVFRASAFIFVLIFLGFYILQSVRKIPMNLGRAGMICGRCKQVTDYTTDTQCSCGGQRELLAHWTWVPHVSDYK
jgi:hypothetical protein